jgi:hypothetical protein
MAAKEKKTEAELKSLIMRATRQHPELNNIIYAAISKQPHNDLNWDVKWLVSGGPLAPAQAREIAEQIRREYHLG